MIQPDLILIGDKVLVRPEDQDSRTAGGLYLPANVKAREKVRSGRVVAVGPGHLMPNPDFSDAEPWAPPRDAVRFLPLQAQPGDFALFLQSEAIDLEYGGELFVILPHHALLAVQRGASAAVR